jgi:hypothetical protein
VADLLEGEYEISYQDRTFKFGGRKTTPYYVDTVEFGQADMNLNDNNAPRSDGVLFGREYRGGRTITFEGNIITAPGPVPALNALEEFQAAWDNEDLRYQPGDVAVLRMRRGGRIRRVYGRPRRFRSTSRMTSHGWIPFVCDFETKDSRYYGDEEVAESISLIPAELGGLTGPLQGPIIATMPGDGEGIITIRGTKPSWLVVRLNGAIINPGIELVGHWKYTMPMTLLHDQWVLVDPTPWARSVRRQDGANLAGVFTADSVRLSQMRVPPGTHQILLTGTDPSHTATAQLFFRDVYSSY